MSVDVLKVSMLKGSGVKDSELSGRMRKVMHFAASRAVGSSRTLVLLSDIIYALLACYPNVVGKIVGVKRKELFDSVDKLMSLGSDGGLTAHTQMKLSRISGKILRGASDAAYAHYKEERDGKIEPEVFLMSALVEVGGESIVEFLGSFMKTSDWKDSLMRSLSEDYRKVQDDKIKAMKAGDNFMQQSRNAAAFMQRFDLLQRIELTNNGFREVMPGCYELDRPLTSEQISALLFGAILSSEAVATELEAAVSTPDQPGSNPFDMHVKTGRTMNKEPELQHIKRGDPLRDKADDGYAIGSGPVTTTKTKFVTYGSLAEMPYSVRELVCKEVSKALPHWQYVDDKRELWERSDGVRVVMPSPGNGSSYAPFIIARLRRIDNELSTKFTPPMTNEKEETKQPTVSSCQSYGYVSANKRDELLRKMLKAEDAKFLSAITAELGQLEKEPLKSKPVDAWPLESVAADPTATESCGVAAKPIAKKKKTKPLSAMTPHELQVLEYRVKDYAALEHWHYAEAGEWVRDDGYTRHFDDLDTASSDVKVIADALLKADAEKPITVFVVSTDGRYAVMTSKTLTDISKVRSIHFAENMTAAAVELLNHSSLVFDTWLKSGAPPVVKYWKQAGRLCSIWVYNDGIKRFTVRIQPPNVESGAVITNDDCVTCFMQQLAAAELRNL